jgi:hypothetical protein
MSATRVETPVLRETHTADAAIKQAVAFLGDALETR